MTTNGSFKKAFSAKEISGLIELDKIELPIKLVSLTTPNVYSPKSLGGYLRSYSGRVFEIEVAGKSVCVKIEAATGRAAAGTMWQLVNVPIVVVADATKPADNVVPIDWRARRGTRAQQAARQAAAEAALKAG